MGVQLSHIRDLESEALGHAPPSGPPIPPTGPDDASSPPIPTLGDLLTADPDRFVTRYTDIAAVNLACATGLEGSEEIDVPEYLRLLDEMAAAVRKRVEVSGRLFKLKPAEFHHSENVFRVLTMQHVLRVQFGVRYNPAFEHLTPELTERDDWTRDSGDIFIHGILGPRRIGTCSSLPTFAIAVGRRAGYPLKLVRVPNHTFFRWDDGNEQFNIERTPAGSMVRSDAYYYEWPHPWDDGMRALNDECRVWLHSMSPRQEVSKFLCNRALQLRSEGRHREALDAIDAAERFEPTNPACGSIEFSILQEMPSRLFAIPYATATAAPLGDVGPAPSPIESVPGSHDLLDATLDRLYRPKWLQPPILCFADGRGLPSTPSITIPLAPSKER